MDAELARCGLAPTPENYVVVATADAPYLTDATWRFIRASIKWWISVHYGVDKAEHFTRLFRDKKPPVKPKRRLPKGVSEQLEQDLITVLRSGQRGRYQLLAADMIEAGIATGLRPLEWKEARDSMMPWKFTICLMMITSWMRKLLLMKYLNFYPKIYI